MGSTWEQSFRKDRVSAPATVVLSKSKLKDICYPYCNTEIEDSV